MIQSTSLFPVYKAHIVERNASCCKLLLHLPLSSNLAVLNYDHRVKENKEPVNDTAVAVSNHKVSVRYQIT